MNEYREKLNQAEANANEIVEELGKLKEAVKRYKTSSIELDEISKKLNLLVDQQRIIVEAQLEQVKAMENVGLAELVENVNSRFYRIDKQFYISYGLIGIMVIVGLLTILIR